MAKIAFNFTLRADMLNNPPRLSMNMNSEKELSRSCIPLSVYSPLEIQLFRRLNAKCQTKSVLDQLSPPPWID